MAFNVRDFQGALKFGGARPSLFEVKLTNKANTQGDPIAPFMIKTASIPGSTLGTIELPYFGRKIKLHGDRTFESWETTIINDEDFAVRNALEEWSASMNSYVGNQTSFTNNPTSYKSDAIVTQYSKTGEILREYKFVGIWPQTVAPIELSWETTDTIEEFSCTWEYDWWEIAGGTTGDAGGLTSS